VEYSFVYQIHLIKLVIVHALIVAVRFVAMDLTWSAFIKVLYVSGNIVH